MFEYIEGDIFNSPAQVIVNTVNTVGVMGKGLALSFKKRYPDMFAAYRTACEKRQLRTGRLMIWYAPDHWILLFPTKENWRYPSKLEYIEAGLNKFVNIYAEKNITSIAFPRLGCGNGELNWDDVRPIMEKYLKSLPIDVYIYLGVKDNVAPEHKSPKETMDWLKMNAKDMSFNGVKDDIMNSTSIIPHSFQQNTKEWSVRWNKGLLFICSENKQEIHTDEDNFLKIWDDIRNQGVFPSECNDPERTLIFALLNSYGYLSEIRIRNNKTSGMIDGYQINEGSGRLFSLRGNS